MQRLNRILCVVVFVTVFLLTSTTWAKDTLVMGVHPYKPAQELYKIFKPIADYISQKLGIPVELQIGKTNEEAIERVGKGLFDFSFLGPVPYVKARDTYKVIPLAQIVNNGSPSFYGVVIVKKGSGITSLSNLKGKSFAFGDKKSTLTHIVPLYMLMEAGVSLQDLKTYAFVGSHDNVALNVVAGAFDAGGLMPDIADKYMERGIEVIVKSPELPEHVFVATKSMADATVTKLQNALLAMDPKLYKGIKPTLTGMQKFNDKDFDILRKILHKVEKEVEK